VIDWKKILEYLKKLKELPFEVVNPFKKMVKVELISVLPKILKDEEYWVFFSNPGGNKFRLGPHETKRVVFSVVQKPRIPSRRPWKPLPIHPKPGIPTPDELLADDGTGSPEEFFLRSRTIKIRIITLINGQNMGGMTYILEPKEAKLPIGATTVFPPEKERPDTDLICETLERQPGVKSTRVRGVTLDIEFEE
jgi:hypothetical protein